MHSDGYLLPEVVDADRLCFVVSVPNNQRHILAFFGQISALSYWYNWQRDDSHFGRLVAKTWRGIFQQVALEYQAGNLKCPPVQLPLEGMEVDLGSPLRIDCDCHVFVTCCDGTEKQIATTDMINAPGQPAGGSPQPKPGGGSAQYCIDLSANGMKLIPTPVSTGDVISIASMDGATNDPSGPAPALWFCGSGDQYFAGSCVNFHNNVGTDPLPASKHLAVIVEIAGAFYDLSAGPVTVGGGVSNVQPTIQVNDSTLSDNNGDIKICVNVVNNQGATWRHVFDFVTNFSSDWQIEVHPGFIPTTFGQWVPGVGMEAIFENQSPGLTAYRRIDLFSSVAANVTRIEVDFAYTAGNYSGFGGSEQPFEMSINGANVLVVTAPAVPVSPLVWTGALATGSGIGIQLASGEDFTNTDPGGSAIITRIVIEGTGADPY